MICETYPRLYTVSHYKNTLPKRVILVLVHLIQTPSLTTIPKKKPFTHLYKTLIFGGYFASPFTVNQHLFTKKLLYAFHGSCVTRIFLIRLCFCTSDMFSEGIISIQDMVPSSSSSSSSTIVV